MPLCPLSQAIQHSRPTQSLGCQMAPPGQFRAEIWPSVVALMTLLFQTWSISPKTFISEAMGHIFSRCFVTEQAALEEQWWALPVVSEQSLHQGEILQSDLYSFPVFSHVVYIRAACNEKNFNFQKRFPALCLEKVSISSTVSWEQ